MLTAQRLIELEQHFGGLHRVKRNKLSPHHKVKPKDEYMQGGDRMGPKPGHGYAEVYARELQRFIGSVDLTIVEIGVLRGTGLAMWSKIFPQARLIGLDIDLTNFDYEGLKRLGAFEHKDPELYVLDQYKITQGNLESLVDAKCINIVIDDGCHDTKAIKNTFRAIYPYLDEDFVYFVEDNRKFLDHFALPYKIKGDVYGELSVIGPWKC